MKALIIVDVQQDFLIGGPLEVPEGDSVIPIINNLQAKYDVVVATQDWHPAHHKSFAAEHPNHQVFDEIVLNGLSQVLWPIHCVQGTTGALLADGLDQERIAAIFRKGMHADIDSYSGFYDNGRIRNTGLHGFLQDKSIEEVHICGLAADFCVYFTAMDALDLGYRTYIVTKGTKAIDKEGYMTKKLAFIREGGLFL